MTHHAAHDGPADPLAHAELVERLRSMMERHPDPELHSVIWSFREGSITRRELYSHPAYGAAMKSDTRRMQVELEARGFTPDRLHDKVVGELTALGIYPREPGQPDIVAAVESER